MQTKRSSHHPGVAQVGVVVSALCTLLAASPAPDARADEPLPPRALRNLDKDYFPFTPVSDVASWNQRRAEIQRRILVSSGLYPMPEKTPLNPVIHGRIEKEDYTVEKVYFESLPGHFVTGNLYLPRKISGKIPVVLCPHGHWPNGRLMMESDKEVARQISIGAEKFENGARSPLQARCVQLARMGCAVFFYDMLGYADSIQFPEHRHGPAASGFVSTEAEQNLVTYFGLQTWNSLRALDFVAGLPYVDQARIGCTGASGGGTQTMVLSALDDRIAAAFPCVMVSTAMQGGCTCENGHYLRINQGNVDIAAATAPRPLGMTAADDWTKELETKGFPDLKNLYTMLGVPDRVEAHFNIQFGHNYNAVSRGQMYAFFNRYFKLGLADTSERDFQILSPRELSVWDDQHPKPSGNNVGEPHEIAILDWFKKQSNSRMMPLLHPTTKADLAQTREFLGSALEVMIGRDPAAKGAAQFATRTQVEQNGCQVLRGVLPRGAAEIPVTILRPRKSIGDVILWLSLNGAESLLNPDGTPSQAAKRLTAQGYTIACPDLYMPGATRNPNVYASAKRKVNDSYEGFSGYHYGYNPTLFAERVRDALALTAALRHDRKHPAHHIFLAGVEGAGPIAAACTALSGKAVSHLICDTAGFRFGNLSSVWDLNFLPGAQKYGDLPGLIALCAPVKTTLVGETIVSAEGAISTYRLAGGKVTFKSSSPAHTLEPVLETLTSR